MEIINSDKLLKNVEKKFHFKNKEYTHMEIVIVYKKDEKSYYVEFLPIRKIENSTSMIPHLKIKHRLLGVNRRSKNNIKKAIDIYNNDVEEFSKILEKAFNVKFSADELKIK